MEKDKKFCRNCSNFDRYENENDGYGGCDQSGYTVHENNTCDKE